MRRLIPFTAVRAALLLAGSCATSFAAGVVVVDDDGGPGVDHVNLLNAIAAAADGDILLVRAGNYHAIPTVAKSLKIVRDGPGEVHTALELDGFSAGHELRLRGLELHWLWIRDSAGIVLLEDSRLAQNVTEREVTGSPRVAFLRCVLEGRSASPAAQPPIPAGPALAITGSTVHLDHCTVSGTPGGDAGIVTSPFFQVVGATGGGPALEVDGSVLSISGGSVAGGAGGDGFADLTFGHCLDAASGGPGLVHAGAPSITRLFGAAVSGGAGGGGGQGCLFGGTTQDGAAGPPLSIGAGTVLTNPTPAPSLTVRAPVREGEALVLTIESAPGDGLLVMMSLFPGFAPAPFYGNAFLLTGADFVLPFGTMDPSGKLVTVLTAPPLVPGLEGAGYVAQVLALPPAGTARLGSASLGILVDDAF